MIWRGNSIHRAEQNDACDLGPNLPGAQHLKKEQVPAIQDTCMLVNDYIIRVYEQLWLDAIQSQYFAVETQSPSAGKESI